jgi:type I restriction enzyme, R subunit
MVNIKESQTRKDLIDPKLVKAGWDTSNQDIKVICEYPIAPGKIEGQGRKRNPKFVDYVLEYKGRKLAVIEAKSEELSSSEGVMQAKEYAMKMQVETAFATNGKEIYEICFNNKGEQVSEGTIDSFPTPEELWNKTFSKHDEWKEKFNSIISGGKYEPRFFQEIAINKTLDAIAEDKKRMLLTLATGTGKTIIAFEIAWKLFHSRWNLMKDGKRQPRILFLTDRNILANQAFNKFSPFPEDALIRIKPSEIKKTGKVPKNGSIFFTIFQTFMSGKDNTPYFGQYPKDYFDLIIIDECHRGGANDEGNWRAIMEYFSPAFQLGLTATPKRKENADTYKYFGKPLYEYSLKEGINDGFLTPFKVRRIKTTIDDYTYTSDDKIIEGEVEEGKIYEETDFNSIIEIKEREEKRVKIFLSEINQDEKSIIFCRTQDHAAAVRDLINQHKKSKEPNYCVRVTANDGAQGEQYLEEFQNDEKTIPTILTTSQKLSTGVDALEIKNIVLMRPINSIIEFKQIIGRGTRLFDGKYFFTIYDFVGAYKNFNDSEWDGEPVEPIESIKEGKKMKVKEPEAEYPQKEIKKKLKIKLSDGKTREIQHMATTSFWSFDGKPISSEEFLRKMFGDLPKFFENKDYDEEQLRRIWESPITRKEFLLKLANAGYGIEELKNLQKLVGAENSDLFDVLEYISFSIKPISREERVARTQDQILDDLDDRQKEFLEFVLSKYVESGVEELDQEKLPALLRLKYNEVTDATKTLGGVSKIKETFIGFQKHLYAVAK